MGLSAVLVSTLIGDITRRTALLADLGHVRLIECADPELEALITHDRTLRALCRLIGDRTYSSHPKRSGSSAPRYGSSAMFCQHSPPRECPP